ncbi:condensation domain-containing protein [Providencia sneebia]|uniref:Amino acid adenylation protein n=1 Tax=Providencia sneebia DSM 19967 TaxID=1141660 RepID=K8W605_9GAMM|nr:condensation domain-containing protein [Providencia sneebia]EKT55964.1 amino acid adenylation protein [Providencia sneebia DSM 19967]
MNYLNNGGDIFPMSDMQKAYWISITDGVLENSSRIQYYCEYNLADFDLTRFTLAWRNILHRHAMLRTVASDDGKQRIVEHLPNDGLSYIDLRGMEEHQKQALFTDTRHQLSHRKFHCSESPQFDLYLLQNTDVTTFLLSLNMWGVDAPSVNIILSDLAHYYYHPQQDLPVLTFQYRDYIHEYSRRENMPDYAQSEAYWDKRLASTNEPPALPVRSGVSRNTDFSVCTENFQQLAHIFSPAEVDLLQVRAKALDINIDTLILSAFVEAVSYWNESQDFSLNIPRFTRPKFSHQINDIVGEFSSFSILSLNLANIPTFEERIRYIHRQYLDDLKHEQVSGSKQLRKLVESNNVTSLTSFPIVFTLSHGLDPQRDALKGRLFGEVQYDISHTPNVLLDCRHEFYQGKLAVRWDYVRNYFADGCIELIFQAFERIVTSIISPDYREYIQQHNVIFLPEEQRKIRQVINNNSVPFSEKPLFRQFAEVMQIPGQGAANAIICEETTLSYQTLFNRACQLGAFIHANRLQQERPAIVAILLPKGWQQIVGVWGVLASGAAYLPLDIDQPASRIEQILEDAQPCLIIVDAKTRHLVPEAFQIPIVDVTQADAIFAQDYVPSATDLPG